MNWNATKKEPVAPKDLYELAAAHTLVPRDMATAVYNYKTMAGIVEWWSIDTQAGEHVADVLITPMPSGIATLDLIPEPKFFAPSSNYGEDLVHVVAPILDSVFGGKYDIRKIEAEVPVSRCRTKRALVTLGFRLEGKRQMGLQFCGKEPEDSFWLGLVRPGA